MDQEQEAAAKIRALIRDLGKTQDLARRGILRTDELADAINRIEGLLDTVLEHDSVPFRLFDRWRITQGTRYRNADASYVDDADLRTLESWLGVITSVVKELDPSVGSLAEAHADLIRELEAQRNLMIAVSTGGPRINDVNGEYLSRQRRIRTALSTLGINDPNPYSDLWAWYSKWSSEIAGYQPRRDYLRRLFEPLLQHLSVGGELDPSLRMQPPAAKHPDIVPGPPSAPKRSEFDVFLCHASEDKDAIARPLYDALLGAGITVWFDEAVIQLGDSLRRKIDDGLARCRFGVVVLSPRFLQKHWPQRELDGLVARETTSGQKAILPVWHELDHDALVKYSPPLADRLAIRSSDGLPKIVLEIRRVLGK